MNEAPKHAVVLAAVPAALELAAYIRPGDFVLACDAGLRNAARLGVRCDLLIADLDSLPAAERPADVPLLRLPTVKDDTDTHHAARWLLEHGCRQATLLGAIGGPRLEHTLGNIATGLYLAQNGVDTLLADAHSELRYLLPGRPLQLRQDTARPWAFFSLFPLDGALHGVEITGAKYPLHAATLTPDYPLGVSNEFAAPAVGLRCTAGRGLVVLTRG